jgi:hypothetical protein
VVPIFLIFQFQSKKQITLAHCNHFFNDHKTVINNNFQNLIRQKLSNDEFLKTAAIVPNAPVQEKQNKFLPTDVSFRILGRFLEVVSLNDNAVRSGQTTEIKTKKLGNIGLDIQTDLRDFEEKIHPEELARALEQRHLANNKDHWQGKMLFL